MTWHLEYTTGDGEIHRLRIDEGSTLRIGRGSTSDTKIEDSAMSRIHCEIRLSRGFPMLADLGSSAGTYVDSKKITESQVLGSGQIFQVGNTWFKIVSDSPLDAPTRMIIKSSSKHRLANLCERLEAKKTLDRFVLKGRVDGSGRNLVFRAEDTENETTVAIKVMPTGDGGDEDVARFKRAVALLRDLCDPSLVKLIRAGRKRNYCWVAMEWLPGGSLEDRIQKYGINGCLEWKDAWRVAHAMALSLHTLEREGIVHRNIRPTSILVDETRSTFVLSDLFVAKAHDASTHKLITQQVYLPSDLSFTAPERLLGNEIDSCSLQSDIYSLGAVLTQLLTGEPPYGHGELRDLLPKLKERRHRVERQGQIGMNEMFVDLVNAMTEPAPKRRIPTALRLWNEVERVGKLSGLSTL